MQNQCGAEELNLNGHMRKTDVIDEKET